MVQLQTDIINQQNNQFNGVLLFLYMAANFILYVKRWHNILAHSIQKDAT